MKYQLSRKQNNKILRLKRYEYFNKDTIKAYTASCLGLNIRSTMSEFHNKELLPEIKTQKSLKYWYLKIKENDNKRNKSNNLLKNLLILKKLNYNIFGFMTSEKISNQAKGMLRLKYKKEKPSKLELYKQELILNKVTKPEQTINPNQKFIGLEIECFFNSINDDWTSLSDHNNLFQDLIIKHGVRRLSAKSDSSIRPNNDKQIGVEFTILLKQSNYETELVRFTNFLKDLNAKVNKSCGMHVHLDQRGVSELELKRTKRNFNKIMDFMFNVVPMSRRSNKYCLKGINNKRQSRYYAINTHSLSKYSTLENRLHSATTEFIKIKHWIDFNLAVLNPLNKLSTAQDFNTTMIELNLSPESIVYFTERFNTFNQTSNEEAA